MRCYFTSGARRTLVEPPRSRGRLLRTRRPFQQRRRVAAVQPDARRGHARRHPRGLRAGCRRRARADDGHHQRLQRVRHSLVAYVPRLVHGVMSQTVAMRELPGRGREELVHERGGVRRATRREIVERRRLAGRHLDPRAQRQEVSHRVGTTASRCPVQRRPSHEIPLVQQPFPVFPGVEREFDALDVVVTGSLAHPALGLAPSRASVSHGARLVVVIVFGLSETVKGGRRSSVQLEKKWNGLTKNRYSESELRNHHKTRLVKHTQTSFIILVYEAFPTHFYIFTTRFCRRHAP